MIRNSLISMTCLILLTVSVLADIPQMINYQGKITDATGDPVADGTYNMRFRIYNVSIGGSELWNSGLQSVAVDDGIFNVLLGESPMPSLDLLFDEDYWLLVTVAGDNQTPRQRLGSVGYAYMASGLVAGTQVVGSVTSGTQGALLGLNTASTGYNYGVGGESNSTLGIGVLGSVTATTGTTYGVWGSSGSTGGAGVCGSASSTTGSTYGVRGLSSSSAGTGVYGHAVAATGNTYGVYGESSSTSGRGVNGYASATAGTTYGVYGESSSGWGCGLYGGASSTWGDNYGVYGWSASSTGIGVYGRNSSTWGSAYGVAGVIVSTSGAGVYGYAGAVSGATSGVYSQSVSTSGRGVNSYASATSGETYGVLSVSASDDGVGVLGSATATSGEIYGVYGLSYSPSGYGVYYSGGLGGSGAMRAIVRTSQGPTAIEAVTATGNWIEDFGEGRLINGRCHIELDPLFLETVTIDAANPMKVFVELGGKCRWVYVERGTTGFNVIEQDDGTSNVTFCYRVVAKRKGFESKRLDYCKAAETDSYLYPELREKELRKLEAVRIGDESAMTGSRSLANRSD